MTAIEPLSKQELDQELASLPNWKIKDGKLHADFKMSDFVEAFAFMTKIAITAEKMGHHPEWFNVYNRVSIDLVTHDAGDAISSKDVELAREIDSFVSGQS